MKYTVYGTPGCNYCTRATNILNVHRKDFDYVNLIEDDEAREWITRIQGHKTVPQVYTTDALGTTEYIGGFEELQASLATP
jgi:glutaredoxin